MRKNADDYKRFITTGARPPEAGGPGDQVKQGTANEPIRDWRPMDPPSVDLGSRGIFIGTSGYHYDDWVGIFNPPKRSARTATAEERADQDRLLFYQKYFSFVEINHTFYQEPVAAQFAGIEKRSGPGMRYAVKVHKDISHTRAWDADRGRELMRRYIAAVGPLAETGRFFSFLVQLEDHCFRTQQRLDYIRRVAEEAVAHRLDVHVEFRHASWHALPVLQSLKDANVGVCNTDIPPVKHAFPLRAYATTDKGYLRYSGRNLDHWYPGSAAPPDATGSGRLAARNARYDYRYSGEELKTLADGQVKLMRKTAAMAIAYNNHYQAKAIRNAIENIRLLRELLRQPGTDDATCGSGSS
jgi:uncharacterized protein YecE (DUF72 family)